MLMSVTGCAWPSGPWCVREGRWFGRKLPSSLEQVLKHLRSGVCRVCRGSPDGDGAPGEGVFGRRRLHDEALGEAPKEADASPRPFHEKAPEWALGSRAASAATQAQLCGLRETRGLPGTLGFLCPPRGHFPKEELPQAFVHLRAMAGVFFRLNGASFPARGACLCVFCLPQAC